MKNHKIAKDTTTAKDREKIAHIWNPYNFLMYV